MGVFKRGNTWWYEFIVGGKRVRESAKTTSKTVAKEAERRRRAEFAKVLNGIPLEKREERINSVADVAGRYLELYPLSHRPSSVTYCRKRLAWVVRLLGPVLVGELTEEAIYGYIKRRKEDGAAGRTINMELGELSRAIGQPWSVLWPKVRKQEERSDVGRAISSEEETRLLQSVDESRMPLLGTFVRLALATGMRAGEIISLQWSQLDMEKRLLQVGKAKTAAGTGRVIPLNESLYAVLSQHASWFAVRFGETRPEWFLFPFGSPLPCDPSKPATNFETAWENSRNRAGVACRFHDLRHTAISRMAEAGVPESTIMALAGHVSRKMLERYSHIGMVAKRKAVEVLNPVAVPNSEGVPTKSPTVERLQ